MIHALSIKVRYLIRLAKTLSTDRRLPRPLRYALRAALAIKVIPFPDFGIDEVILVIVGLLMVTVYRPQFRAIRAELSSGESQ